MEKVKIFNAKIRAAMKRPNLKAGDIVKVHRKIKEGEKERIQIFEGIVIGVKGRQSSSPTATIRRVSFGTGVEITIPIYSPSISKIEVVKQAQVRRAKLFYLRKKGLRISKLKTKELEKFAAEKEKEEPEPETEKAEKSEGTAKKTEQDQPKEASKAVVPPAVAKALAGKESVT